MNNHRLLTGLLCATLLSGGVCSFAQTRQVLSIEDLFEIAEANSVQLRPSFSAEEEAKREISVARSGRLPDINASLSLSYIGDGFTTKRNFSDYQKAPIPHLGTGLSLSVNQPLYTGGAIKNSIELAELKSTAARYSTEFQRDNIRFQLAGIVPVNSRVQGYVKEIRFKEYEQVKKGDTLVIIDDSDLRLRVAQAQADYQTALSGREVADRSVGVASANVAVTEASIAEAKVVMDMAATDFDRYKKLLEQEAVTRQQYDAAKTDYEAKKARYEMLARQRSATSSVVAETKQRISQNDAGIELAKALLETAELNLSYCVITAPCDGYASRKEIQVGQLVQPGQTLLDVVDSADVWITANYKETQLQHISKGSDVVIKVDAIPDVEFKGKVVSLSKATGASLSILPQDNSAGNFVKVRQRVPVRIEFSKDNNVEAMSKLRAGMNVECEVKY